MARETKMDSGWAWVVVIAGFYIGAIWGAANRCYSVLYSPIMEEYNVDYATVSKLNGYFQIAYGIGGGISAPLFKIADIRVVMMLSGAVASGACLAAFFAKEITYVLFCVGIICGVSCGPAMLGCYTMFTLYFKKRIHAAFQLMSVGTSFGSFIFCPLFQVLVDKFGWKGSIMILSGFFLNFCVAGSLMRMPNKGNTTKDANARESSPNGFNPKLHDDSPTLEPKSNTSSRLAQKFDLVVLTNPLFYTYVICYSAFGIAYYSAMFYMVPFAKTELELNNIKSSSLLSSLAVGEIISKVLMGAMTDRIAPNKRLYLLSTLNLCIGIVMICIPHVHSYFSLMCMCLSIGLFGGGMNGFYGAHLSNIFELKHYTSVYGYSNFAIFSTLMGATILWGVSIDHTQKFTITFTFGGISSMWSAGMLLVMDKIQKRKKLP